MEIRWKGASNSTKILFGIVISILIIIAMFYLWKIVPQYLPKIATDLTQTQITLPSWVETPVEVVLGQSALNGAESLILALAVFLILFFAFADIINMFSTFGETTSWVIAFGLAIIAGVTKMLNAIIVWLGLTAGIGALGIGFIILSAVFTAVVVNLVLGKNLRKSMKDAKTEAEIDKAAQTMHKGFGLFKSASKEVESA